MAQALLGTIAAEVRAEHAVKRSRFIATLAPAADVEAADRVIAAARKEFYDARHHCTAMVLGPDGGQQRSSDDGEPAGTAGAPMLAALRGSALTDVVAVVTRYFGGTLLGAGGLVRAYGRAVTDALGIAVRLDRRLVAVVVVRSSHEAAGRLENVLRGRLDAVRGEITATAYDVDGPSWWITLDHDEVDALTAILATTGLAYQLDELGTEIRTVRG